MWIRMIPTPMKGNPRRLLVAAELHKRGLIIAALLLLGTLVFTSVVRSSWSSGTAAIVGCRGLAGAHDAGTSDTAASKAFSRIYDHKTWGDDGNGSGSGSTTSATKFTRLILEMLVHKYNIRTLIDAPCGAMRWAPLFLERVFASKPCFSYLGLDTVPSVIKKNKQTFAEEKRMAFAEIDLGSAPLAPLLESTGAVVPAATAGGVRGASDGVTMILCRDALQHLDFPLAINMLKNFAFSGADYLLVGSYYHYNDPFSANRLIKIGDYFQIDVRFPPFNLGGSASQPSDESSSKSAAAAASAAPSGTVQPIDVFDEGIGANPVQFHGNKLLLLYRLADLRTLDFDAMLAEAAKCDSKGCPRPAKSKASSSSKSKAGATDDDANGAEKRSVKEADSVATPVGEKNAA